MNEEIPKQPQREPRKNSWLFTAFCCLYFAIAGWAAYKTFPILATLLAGQGFSISSDSFLFHLLLSGNYVRLMVVGTTAIIALALAKQVGNFSDRYRRLVNLVLLIVAIGSAPSMLLLAMVFTLPRTLHLIGKLAQ